MIIHLVLRTLSSLHLCVFFLRNLCTFHFNGVHLNSRRSEPWALKLFNRLCLRRQTHEHTYHSVQINISIDLHTSIKRKWTANVRMNYETKNKSSSSNEINDTIKMIARQRKQNNKTKNTKNRKTKTLRKYFMLMRLIFFCFSRFSGL